jgi:hypothetical protein
MNTIERDKAYIENKKYVRDIYFNQYITNELKHKVNELYDKLTINNFSEIKQQVKDLFSEFERSLLKENELKNQLHEEIIYHRLSFLIILLGLVVFIIPYSPLYSARRIVNEFALTAWLTLLSLSVLTMFISYFIKILDINQRLAKVVVFLENLFVILFLLTFSLLLPMVANYFGVII